VGSTTLLRLDFGTGTMRGCRPSWSTIADFHTRRGASTS